MPPLVVYVWLSSVGKLRWLGHVIDGVVPTQDLHPHQGGRPEGVYTVHLSNDALRIALVANCLFCFF